MKCIHSGRCIPVAVLLHAHCKVTAHSLQSHCKRNAEALQWDYTDYQTTIFSPNPMTISPNIEGNKSIGGGRAKMQGGTQITQINANRIY